MKLGEIVKEYRDQHDLSMSEFALRLGMSKAYVSMLEKNYNPSTKKPIIPSVHTLKKCANAMGKTLDDLVRSLDSDQLVNFVNPSEKDETLPPNYYYINPETAAIAQAIHDNPELRVLMDASKDLSPEDVKFVADLVQRMKKKESGEDE